LDKHRILCDGNYRHGETVAAVMSGEQLIGLQNKIIASIQVVKARGGPHNPPKTVVEPYRGSDCNALDSVFCHLFAPPNLEKSCLDSVMHDYLNNLNLGPFVPLFEAKNVLLDSLIFHNISHGRVILPMARQS
jgi:hypothetical protein